MGWVEEHYGATESAAVVIKVAVLMVAAWQYQKVKVLVAETER